jgi:tetratricopeptide (TPR) repeat protein
MKIENCKLKIQHKKPVIGITIAIICGVVMLFGAVFLATNPLRASFSKQFITRGDDFLNQKKYVSAIVEYKKADFIAPSGDIKQKISFARESETDVYQLENFYRQNNNIGQQEVYNQVRAVPDSSYDMVTLSKTLIEQNEPQLAIEAARTATEMDKEYRDAWLYLGISNLAVAKQVELSGNNSQTYLDRGKQALQKAKLLDPSYAATNDILKQL